MQTQQMTYDVCQRYLRDAQPQMGDLYKVIDGYLRSRRIDLLSECSKLFDCTLYSVDTFRHLRQIEAFFKKNSSFTDDEKCLDTAINSFMENEEQCLNTNRRLDKFFVERGLDDPDLYKKMSRMERWIEKVLGPFGTFIEGLPLYVRVTSGASATLSRRNAQPHLKVRKRINAPLSSAPYLNALSQYFGYGDIKVRGLNFNRVEFVPKNWKTYRTIACEPVGSLPLQLAFDTYAKAKLRRVGVDLSDQFRNQELARLGSTGERKLSTVDMKAASDTVSFNTVAWLLPEPWFKYLNDIRSPYYRSDKHGLLGQYAKFSSMGNGATFVLESLIFAAACVASGAKEWSVYGDDIIIDTDHFEPLMKLMNFLGFVINQEKTFTSGPFRESCGKDWFQGTDVTPFYLRGWEKRKAALSHNVNGLASISLPGGSLWAYLKDLVSKYKLHFVPYNGVSTSGVWIDIHSAYTKRLLRNRFWIQTYKAYVAKEATQVCLDSRTLFLWYLDSSRIGPYNSSTLWVPSFRGSHIKMMPSTTPLVRSRVPTFGHKYVRKWVHWIPPVTGAPDHLYWWSDYLSA